MQNKLHFDAHAKAIAASLIILLGVTVTQYTKPAEASDEVCPKTNGWTKVDNDNYYTVAGATEYCYKAGSEKSKGCEGGLFSTWPQTGKKVCGLSHWSYYVPKKISPTPTPEPTATPSVTPSVTPTVTPSPTEMPTATPTPTKTPTPTDEPTGGIQPTPTPQPTSNPTNSPTPTTEAGRGGVSSSQSEEEPQVDVRRTGQVLGISTMAETGTAMENLASLIAFASGTVLIAYSRAKSGYVK